MEVRAETEYLAYRKANDFESVGSLVKDTVITEENQLSGAR